MDIVEDEEGELSNTNQHSIVVCYLLGMYTNESLHSPSLLILSAPLTLKEYTTPICSGSTILYCDVVVMLVMLMIMVLVAVTST